tara:strand:+ start:593 stop:835 length:243 start_codon:yes stop_codon:yes gene_type:complete
MWYEIGIIQKGRKREGSYKYVKGKNKTSIRKNKNEKYVGKGVKIGSITKLEGKGKAWVHVKGRQVKKTVDWDKPKIRYFD